MKTVSIRFGQPNQTVGILLAALLAVAMLTACGGEQYSELMSAAGMGDNEAVLRIIARGSDVNERSSQGKTPLLIAANAGHAETVRTLLLKGADINTQDSNGTTPLIAAATYGHTEAVSILVEKGANPNIRDNNKGTALINAVFFNYQGTVNEILKLKEQLSKEDLEEAFLLASGLGNTGIIADMLKLGIDVNATGHNNRTPLMAAINFDHPDTVKVLLEGGANINTRDSNGHTPLSLALDQGNDEIIKMLKSAKK